jgi:hypothetical protein
LGFEPLDDLILNGISEPVPLDRVTRSGMGAPTTSCTDRGAGLVPSRTSNRRLAQPV